MDESWPHEFPQALVLDILHRAHAAGVRGTVENVLVALRSLSGFGRITCLLVDTPVDRPPVPKEPHVSLSY